MPGALPAHAGERLTIAAAADLKFALREVIASFETFHPGAKIDAIYGSSGNIHTQIQQGAPYDLFFSADIAYPRALAAQGLTVAEVQPYALGRIVLWGLSPATAKMTLDDLADPVITRVAIAHPRHAPYGQRAEEALRSAGVWEIVEPKLVYGENVAQTAQFVQTGNAQIGIIALSLALSPELGKQGAHALISDKLHRPLLQGLIITRRAAGNALATAFAAYVNSREARAIMGRYGFVLPGAAE